MKAITLWEPWALLWALQIKKYETRGWATNYRGPIAIHAAAKSLRSIYKEIFPCSDYEFHPSYFVKKEFCDALKENGINENELPLGCIIATAELVDCHKIVRHGGRGMSSEGPGWLETEDGIYLPTEQELLFGDWTPGRYAWELRNIKMLDEPIPAKGHQRLWNWEEDVLNYKSKVVKTRKNHICVNCQKEAPCGRMNKIKVYQLNDCEWYAIKGDLEDLIDWYRQNIDDSETIEEMFDEAKECDLDKDGMWWQTEDKEDLEKLGTADELISRDESNELNFGSLQRFGNEVFKYIPFREAIEYDLDFTEPYCIATTEW